MIGTQYLTLETVVQINTFPGQAHFATDPVHTCRECYHWEKSKQKTSRCLKASSMLKQNTPRIPHTAQACKYLELIPPVPPANPFRT